MEIQNIELNGFAEKLFSDNPKYNNIEFEIVQSMTGIQRRFHNHFSKEDIYQHGWCVLRKKKRETITAFEKALIYHLVRNELFVFKNHPESYLTGDEQTTDDQTEIILRDLIKILKENDGICEEVLELYLERYSERDIARKCGLKHHETVGRIIERGIEYVCKI